MQSLTQPSPSGEGFWLLSPAGEGLGMRVLPGEPWESAKVGCTQSLRQKTPLDGFATVEGAIAPHHKGFPWFESR